MTHSKHSAKSGTRHLRSYLLARTAVPIVLAFITWKGAFGQQAQLDEFTPCRNGCQSLPVSGGNVLVPEGGNFANTDRVVFADHRGDQLALPVIGGLPTGKVPNGTKYGPTAYALLGRTLYIAIGENDQFHSTGPNFNARVMPAPFTPIVIQVKFSADPANAGPFLLQPAERQMLLSGLPVTLMGFSNTTATFSRLAALDPGAHPSGIAVLPTKLFVVDSGTHVLLQIDRNSGLVTPFLQLTASPDMKAENIRAFSGKLLITFFSATANQSSVQLVNPVTGQQTKLIGNLTSAVDVAPRPGRGQFIALENSVGGQGLGQVLLLDASGTPTAVLASGLNDPTSLTLDEANDRALVFARGDGVIYSIPLP
jgi:hypothetical protein